MTNDKGIFIKNIYYMLSYAFQVLRQYSYESVATEKFDHVQDLLAAILAKGVARQLKQGLYREYVPRQESLPVLRGKLEMSGTLRSQIQHKQELACAYDELSEDNLFNQILKTAMHQLLKDGDVGAQRKRMLGKTLLFFDGVSLLEPSKIAWSRIRYQRCNKNYEMLLNICYLVMDGRIQTTEQGERRLAAFSDEHMARLFERFILAYYREHHTYLSEARAAQVKWDLTGENDEAMIRLLPVMQTDVFLRLDEKVLILDAKYYGKTLQQQFDRRTLHSGNLYQIYTYVKNQDKGRTGNVAGMLIYAKTQEEITPDCVFNMGGNLIGAKTLDLNREFKWIALQLDAIAEQFFGKRTKQA